MPDASTATCPECETKDFEIQVLNDKLNEYIDKVKEQRALIEERKSIKKMRVLHERVERAEKDRDSALRDRQRWREEYDALAALHNELKISHVKLDTELRELRPLAEVGLRFKDAIQAIQETPANA